MTIVTENPPQDKPALLAQLQQLVEMVDTAAQGAMAAHEIEHRLFRGVLALGHELMERFFVQLGDGDEGERRRLNDGREVKRLEPAVERRYVSVFGEHRPRRYGYAPRAGQRIACVPFDARVALPEGQYSYLLQDWAQGFAVDLAYRQVCRGLERVLGLTLGVSLLERQTQAMATPVQPFWKTVETAPSEAGEFIVISADGKGVPIRNPDRSRLIEAHAHKRGPKPDRKRMAIVGAAYDMHPYCRTPRQVCEALFRRRDEPPGESATPRPKPIAKLVRAQLPTIDDNGEAVSAREPLFAWLGEQLRQRDPEGDKPVVVLIDGQHCLWQDARQILKGRKRIEILDLLHATAKLWEVVHTFHPPDSDDALVRMKIYTLLLLQGHVVDLIHWFGHLADQAKLKGHARKRVDDVCGYFANHRHRMHYHRYLAAGYPIATGVIEGACRHVVKDRMERSGMRWTLDSAQAMLDLRCVWLNDQWEDFTRYRIEQENERLYPYADQFKKTESSLALAA